jgi:type II secretory pathway component PulF
MPTFNYRAKDMAGNTIVGTIEAEDERQAAGKIREKGALPMDIRPAAGVGVVQDRPAGSVVARYLIYPLWTGVNIRALLFFFKQMGALLGAGVSLSEALRSVESRQRGKLRRIIHDMHQRVIRGGRLSEEMARHPHVFSRLQMSLVRVGESSGFLEKMTDRIAAYLEYELSVRRRIILVTFYPVLIFLFILFKDVGVAFILGGAKAGLPMLLDIIQRIFLPLVGVLVGLKLMMQFEPPRYVWDFVKMFLPILGTTARKVAMSRFSRALAILYSAGIPLSEAVSTAADACANTAVAKGVKQAVRAIQAGESLTLSLQRTGVVMPIVLDMLSTGEKTGNLDTVLQKVADYMDEEVDATIHKVSISLFVLMILAAGVIVLLQVLEFYSGYFNKLIGGSGG